MAGDGEKPKQPWLISFFSALLLVAVYGLGVRLFTPRVGLWAAGLCLLLPGLYLARLDFLLDYPLVAMVTLCFCCLTYWRYSTTRLGGWLWAIVVGLTLGLALMVKQPALFFLFTPLVWVSLSWLKQRAWERWAQLMVSLGVAVLVFGPWYRTNWLLMFTAGKRATIDSAIAEGDPALNTLGAWTYYWHEFPKLVSWPLLLVPLVGLLLHWLSRRWPLPGFTSQGGVGCNGKPGSGWRSFGSGLTC
ncbi:ArnT family glycosyltransferase [Neosynechococcus sphagnicola]|uniref:ArnT family glycosyltransferase n=1 Tax=Neosynechococcus sphagnicola TaxID=1501145 RepID=UPI000907BD85|nr:phospholipid carrier-dependent glycosyltransferase [Neosynechococcus sphagnicola]